MSTVSYALRGKGNISKDVRRRIIRISQEIGYQKNIHAEAMATSKSRNIAILLQEDYEKVHEWSLIRNMFIQLESVITSAGYFPVLLTTSFNAKTKDLFEKIASSGIGALFSIHYGNVELFNLLEDHKIPVVVINNADYEDKFFSVCSDDFHGAYQGASYLLKLGHTKIGYIDYHRPDFKRCFSDRFIGFKTAIAEHDVVFNDQNRITVSLQNKEELREKIIKLVTSPYKLTALFVHDDFTAAKTIVILESMDLNIPGDLSIIAPGDTLDYNQEYIPRITTMQIDTALLGKLAGEMMIDILSNKYDKLTSLKIRQQLVDRGSCVELL